MLKVNSHLWRDVVRRPAEGLRRGVTRNLLLAHAKVRDLDVAVLVEEDVVQLEVAVDDAVGVEVEQADRDLGGVKSVERRVV